MRLPSPEELRAFRLSRHWTLERLAHGLGVNVKTYSNYESRTAFPVRLMPALMELGFVFPGTEAAAAISESRVLAAMAAGRGVSLPTIPSAFAGDESSEEVFDGEAIETEVPALFLSHDPAMRSSYVALVVSGRSMVPRIEPSDLLVVRVEPNPPFGVLVAARDSDGARTYVKALRYDRGLDRTVLAPVNPRFAPIVELSQWTMIGGVIGRLRRAVTDEPNIEYMSGAWLRA